MSKTLLEVPYVSQYSIGRDSDGLSRACGAACVKMIIDYRKSDSVDLLDIVREGRTIKGAYISGVGWAHAGLAAILRNHNVGAYSQEFRAIDVDSENQKFLPSTFESEHIERGVHKIAGKIEEKKPVIISGIKYWRDTDKPHSMLFIGVEKEGDEIKGFYYHDPEDEEEQGEKKLVDIDTFRRYWRKFAIFID